MQANLTLYVSIVLMSSVDFESDGTISSDVQWIRYYSWPLTTNLINVAAGRTVRTKIVLRNNCQHEQVELPRILDRTCGFATGGKLIFRQCKSCIMREDT